MGTPNQDEMQSLNFLANNNNNDDVTRRGFSTRMKSASFPIPVNSWHGYEQKNDRAYFTGPLRHKIRNPFVYGSGASYASHNHEVCSPPPRGSSSQAIELNSETHQVADEVNCNDWPLDNYENRNRNFFNSGQMELCDDPCCMMCPTYYNVNGNEMDSRTPEHRSMFYKDVMGRAKKISPSLLYYVPGIMNPHSKVIRKWRMFFSISCLFSAFLDPLFFFLLSVQENSKCIALNWPLTITIMVFRCTTDFVYLLHILLQFRLAYVAPEAGPFGAGVLVDDPKRIFRHYLFGYFMIDLFIMLPLPQIIILLMLPGFMGTADSNYANNHLTTAILIQYIPKLFRFWCLLAGPSIDILITESAWPNFVVNVLIYIFASHVVGSCWYLFGIQRVRSCLRMTCRSSNITSCVTFIDCGQGNDLEKFEDDPTWEQWKNTIRTTCFSGKQGPFDYGIYQNSVNLTANGSLLTRYVYSLFWGFQQMTTMAANQTPSYFIGEVLFTSMGLLLFSLLTGNIQNYIQCLDRRRKQAYLRRLEINRWMTHRRLPEEIKRKVQEAELFNWAATKGLNEHILMENLPEDLQRDIWHYLFKVLRKVRLFQLLDEPVVDAICEKLRAKTYIKESKILFHGGPVDKMVFITRGKMECVGADRSVTILHEGDVCGEELLCWCLVHSSLSKDGTHSRIARQRLLSNRTVRCLTNVEAYILPAADLKEIARLYARSLRNPRVQGSIRYESAYYRELAAKRIQVAWRYRKKRIARPNFSRSSI